MTRVPDRLPGANLVGTGIEDLRRVEFAVEALLVAVAAPACGRPVCRCRRRPDGRRNRNAHCTTLSDDPGSPIPTPTAVR